MNYITHYDLSVSAGEDILSEDFTSDINMTQISKVLLWVIPEDTGILTLVRKKDGEEYTEILKNNCSLNANCAYDITILMSEDDLNLRYSTDTTFKYLQMREII